MTRQETVRTQFLPGSAGPSRSIVGSSDCAEIKGEKDSLALLEEILGCSSTDEGDLLPDWKNLFGDDEEASSSSLAAEVQTKENSFLPSQLLEHSFTSHLSALSGRFGRSVETMETVVFFH